MLQAAVLLLLTASACWGQFQSLAATDNGDRLYFSSRLRQTGSEQYLHPKIFEWSVSEGFHLIAQREQVGPGSGFFNFFELMQPDVSGDGSVVSFVGVSPCGGGSHCVFHDFYQASLLPGEGEPVDLGLGFVQVSRTGRYAVLFGPRTTERIDLETLERIPTLGAIAAERQAITSNGELLLNGFGNPGLFVLWSPSSYKQLAPEFVVDRTAIISDDGSRVIFHTPDGAGFSLWAIRTDGTDARQLASSRDYDYAPAISNDGRWVVFEAEDRVMIVDLVAIVSRALVAPADGVAEATISGMGNAVFVATRSNRLLRVDVTSGEVEELTPRIPVVGSLFSVIGSFYGVPAVFGAPVPGSLNWVRGTGLADALVFASFPLPESLDGVEVLLGSLTARIVAVAPEQIVYQIPFEASLGEMDLRLTKPPAPFEAPPLKLDLKSQALQFVRNGYEAWAEDLRLAANIVVDQNFTRLVTETQPAAPEDIVHLYATGGGKVAALVVTGEATPAEPLPAVSAPVECFQIDGFERRPLETFYAGLAPGLIGVYQVTLRLPKSTSKTLNDPTVGLVQIGCGEGEAADFPTVFMRLDP